METGRSGWGRTATQDRPEECGHLDRSLSILVVDDNADSADGLAILLSQWKHDVRVAYAGEDALELYRMHRPDLVLLDIALPGISGYEVARRLRRQDRRATLVAVTGFGELRDRRRALAAGFREHFVKPLDADALRSLIANISNTE